MKITAKQYAKTLYETLQDTVDNDHNTVLDNFVKVLATNNDIKLFDQIVEEFHVLEKEAKGIKMVEVASAQPLDKHSEKLIIEQLNDLAKTKVEIKHKIDENLIGGVVIKMDDTLIDASVKRSLEELKQDLSQ